MTEDWVGALKDCDTVERFNGLALSLARERRARNPKDGFAKAVATEAKKRGYTYTGDKENGFYVELTREEYDTVIAELKRREHREHFRRFVKKARKTRVPLVSAAWEQWVYRGEAELGALILLDYRQRAGNSFIYEFDKVPRNLYLRLFGNDAKASLDNIFRMFGNQTEAQSRNWGEAF